MKRRTPPPPSVQSEWLRRAVAEHQSACITADLLSRLFHLDLQPDILSACHRIVDDELTHSRLSAEVAEAAGADLSLLKLTAPPEIPGVEKGSSLLQQSLGVCAAVFCCGESAAVPLFVEMHAGAKEKIAERTLRRILKDEGRHRTFGWRLLAMLIDEGGASAIHWLRRRVRGYTEAVRTAYEAPDHDVSAAERRWGLMPPSAYRQAAATAISDVIQPRFIGLKVW